MWRCIMEFKVGDIITGKTNSYAYTYTNERSICKIIQIIDTYSIEVEILEQSDYPGYVGAKYKVDPNEFILATAKMPNYKLEKLLKFKNRIEERHKCAVSPATPF